MRLANLVFSLVFGMFWLGISIGSLPGQQDVWQMQSTGVDASLRGLCVVDANVVWSSGSGGTVIRSVDGGVNWENVSVAEAKELDFRDIHAFDQERAVILSAGQPARVYKTVDGGKNWKQVFEHPNEKSFFDALSFWDEKHGVAMSDPIDGQILLIETKDGGNSWSELTKTSRPKAKRGEGGFAASGTNMVVFGDSCLIALGSAEKDQQEKTSRVVYSADRGKSWQEAIVPMPRNQTSGMFSMAFTDSVRGIVVGGDYQKQKLVEGNIALTLDAGRTWQKPTGSPPRGYRSGVAYVKRGDPQKLVAVGPMGTDVSNDGGQNWTGACDTGFHAVAFTTDGSAGWASGSDGRIGKWVKSSSFLREDIGTQFK